MLNTLINSVRPKKEKTNNHGWVASPEAKHEYIISKID